MSSPLEKPLLDGEKIPGDVLRDIFQEPPGKPLDITRSTLLVGSRGAGKTTLLRYLAASEPETTIYLSLLDELGAIARDAATLREGAEAPDFGSRQGAKAEALLGLALIREALLTQKADALRKAAGILRPIVGAATSKSATAWLSQARAEIGRASDAMWDGVRNEPILRGVCDEVSLALRLGKSPVRLLFDRADMVPAYAVMPVLRLLDQAGGFFAVVATRPAPFADPDWGVTGTVHALDHYAVKQVCTDPRDLSWEKFMRSAIRAQYGKVIDEHQMPQATLDAIVYYARDSVRIALELTYQVLKPNEKSWQDRLIVALDATRHDVVRTADAALKRWQRRFSKTVDEWRDHVLVQEKTLTVKGPVVVTVTSGVGQPELADGLRTATNTDRFIAAALSVGALGPPSGAGWGPGVRLDAVEVPPILTWRPPDRPVSLSKGRPISINMSSSTFGGSTGRRSKKGKVFVGLRFAFQDSLRFYEQLGRAVKQHPQLEGVRLLNGRLPGGTAWAEGIRNRIESCRVLLVADVTGARGDLLFELGMGWGLRRPVLPVTATLEDASILPKWMRRFNFGCYETSDGVYEIAADISEHLQRKSELRPPRLPEPIPRQVLLVGKESWNEHAFDRIKTLADREGLKVNEVPGVGVAAIDNLLDAVARSALVVVPSDGTMLIDSFTHFVAGSVAARPTAGQQSASLPRRVIVVRRDAQVSVPDSITNCPGLVDTVLQPEAAAVAAQEFLSGYKRWIRSGK